MGIIKRLNKMVVGDVAEDFNCDQQLFKTYLRLAATPLRGLGVLLK